MCWGLPRGLVCAEHDRNIPAVELMEWRLNANIFCYKYPVIEPWTKSRVFLKIENLIAFTHSDTGWSMQH